MKPLRLLTPLAFAVVTFALPYSAGAAVKKEGSWPIRSERVSLEFDGKPSEGLKKLAKEAAWGLVVQNGVDLGASDIHVDVDDQPADAVLDALFVGRDVVAYRQGTLITLRTASDGAASATTPAVAASPTPPAPPSVSATPRPMPPTRGEDRTVFGGKVVIAKDEVAGDVVVVGGKLIVEGTVTGDLVVVGGAATVASHAHVYGDATAVGGKLEVERDGRIDGEVGVAGGVLDRDDGAIIGGKVVDDDHPGQVKLNLGSGQVNVDVDPGEAPPARSWFGTAAHDFGQSMTRMALLFALGSTLLALLTARMDRLQTEVAIRPMRSFALGVLWTVLGSIGGLILLVVLCITIIGIPVAVAAVLAGVLAVYAGIASVLTTFGAAVFGHRSKNPYVHLLIGCAAFLVLSSIPWVGWIVTFAVTMLAIGSLAATRVGGLLERRRPALV